MTTHICTLILCQIWQKQDSTPLPAEGKLPYLNGGLRSFPLGLCLCHCAPSAIALRACQELRMLLDLLPP